MKRVLTSEGVAHAWAHKRQTSARNSSGSLYFDGSIIYSYGDHFPVARHVEFRGQPLILITKRKYSITTLKHVGIVAQAIPPNIRHIRTSLDIKTPFDAAFVTKLLDELATEHTGAIARALKATTNTVGYKQLAKEIAGLYSTTATFFCRHRSPLTISQVEQSRIDAKCIQQAARFEHLQTKKLAKDLREKLRREAEDRETLPDKITRFRAGEYVPDLNHYAGFDYLRINGDKVETSRACSAPIEDARRIKSFVLNKLATGSNWQRGSLEVKIGEYLLESIDTEGIVTIGCHKFQKEEVLNLLEQI